MLSQPKIAIFCVYLVQDHSLSVSVCVRLFINWLLQRSECEQSDSSTKKKCVIAINTLTKCQITRFFDVCASRSIVRKCKSHNFIIQMTSSSNKFFCCCFVSSIFTIQRHIHFVCEGSVYKSIRQRRKSHKISFFTWIPRELERNTHEKTKRNYILNIKKSLKIFQVPPK